MIAAAPKLLEALQKMLDLECPLTGNPTREELIEHWEYEQSQGNGAAEYHLFAWSVIAEALSRKEVRRTNYYDKIEWLQKANTLHRQADILYVVDGYDVTITWDENPISEAFHGGTLDKALEAAMKGFDLDAPYIATWGLKRYPGDVQFEALIKTLDELANGYVGNDWDVGLRERLLKARALLKELKP